MPLVQLVPQALLVTQVFKVMLDRLAQRELPALLEPLALPVIKVTSDLPVLLVPRVQLVLPALPVIPDYKVT